jgi:DNA-binding response OmpR family regulator
MMEPYSRVTSPPVSLLVMDDDPMIREVLASVLERSGYRCEVAVEGAEAIARFTAARGTDRAFSAVVVDLAAQAGLGGRETLEGLRRIDPSVPALVLTGWAHEHVAWEGVRAGFDEHLAKPFASSALIVAVRALLARREQAA